MARALTGTMQTQLRSLVVTPCWLVKLQFNSGYIYLTSRTRDVAWSGQTWLANNWLRSIDGLSNVFDHSSNEVTVTIGGLDPTILSLILSSTSQKNTVDIYFGLIDASGNLYADPYLLFTGLFDDSNIDDSSDETEVGMVFTSPLARISKINVFRFTHQSQQALFAGDLGFQYVSQAADWKGFWGKASIPKSNQKRKRNDSK